MDGEVNNRNARIAQDVKRDNTDEHRQTHETDNTRWTTRDETDAGDKHRRDETDTGDEQHKTDRRNRRRR